MGGVRANETLAFGRSNTCTSGLPGSYLYAINILVRLPSPNGSSLPVTMLNACCTSLQWVEPPRRRGFSWVSRARTNSSCIRQSVERSCNGNTFQVPRHLQSKTASADNIFGLKLDFSPLQQDTCQTGQSCRGTWPDEVLLPRDRDMHGEMIC